ncbi:MAG TPA: hypothetical protein VJX72_04095 [Candidatus Acidoferrum sp.]|nr:hypothetical protein [Candidatus Acidoferrum sp.]
MSERTPEPRMPVMIVVEVSWADQSGTLQRSRARMGNRSVSGTCIRLKPQIQVGTNLRVQWRWAEFTGVARYCRNDGREHVVGIQRNAETSANSKKPVLVDVPVRHGARNSEASVSPAIIESLPERPEDKPTEIPVTKLKLDTVAILPFASSSAAIPARRVAHEAESREIPRSLQPLDFDTLPRTEKQTKQPPKEKEAGKERIRMRSKWLGLVQKDDKQDSVNGNGDGRSNERGDLGNRAPVPVPQAEHASADAAEESAVSSPIELLPMEDIYRAAGIMNPRKGYSINKVIEMLHSEHIRGSSKEMKRASVLMALDAAGISVDEVLQDARVRQEAIDAYEAGQRKQFEALLAQKAEENIQIQAELERVKARYGERLRRNLDGMAREKGTFGNWLTLKQQESQSMAEAVELCLKTPVNESASSALPEDSLVNASTKPV